ncbi:MAG: glycosyltransferase [Candidatus Accumulibacter sp.]|jgi:glycosyltransferase involved in cell wall biosynthesis/GT2 family glycosyltransferase/Tfp pilus assembly protein PilF|nr:glycosyltransferase [Accumulibacter sp.]
MSIVQVWEHPGQTAGPAPLVSVIIPTMNRLELLGVALESLCRQTFKDFEVVIVNDAGESPLPAIEPFAERLEILYLSHEANKGVSGARNTGIRNARGHYIAYLDDDDICYEEHLEAMVNTIRQSYATVVYADVNIALQREENGRFVTYTRWVHSVDFDPYELLRKNFILMLCVMHEKRCIDEVGYFRENLKGLEDWDFLMRMSRFYTFMHLPFISSEYVSRIGGDTLGQDKETMSTTKVYLRRIGKWLAQIPRVEELRARLADAIVLCRAPEAAYGLSVIVHMTAPTLGACFEALGNALPDPGHTEIILIADGDAGLAQTLAELLAEFAAGQMTLIEHPRPVGRTLAHNHAAGLARGERLLFLSPEAAPAAEAIASMLAVSDEHGGKAIVASRLVRAGAETENCCGGRVDAAGEIHIVRVTEPDAGARAANWMRVDCAPAACLLVPAEVFAALDGFRPRYAPVFFEDADFCLRARDQAGIPTLCALQASAVLQAAAPSEIDRPEARVNAVTFAADWGRPPDPIHSPPLPSPEWAAPFRLPAVPVDATPFPAPGRFEPLLPPGAFDGPVLWASGSLTAGGVEAQLIAAASLLGKILKPHLLCQALPDKDSTFPLEQAQALFGQIHELDNRIPYLESFLVDARPRVRRLFGELGGFAGLCAAFTAFYAALRPKAVHVWNSDHLWMSLGAILAGVPHVIVRCGSFNPSQRYKAGMESIDDTLAAQAFAFLLGAPGVRIIANTTAVRDDYAAWLGIERTQIRLAPNVFIPGDGHGSAQRAMAMRAAWSIPPDAPIVGGLFRFTALEDPELCLKAAERVLLARADVYAVIGGDGPLYAALARAAKNSPVSDRLLLPGKIDDALAFHAMCSVHLDTSRLEGSCHSVMEAQYHQIPVVGIDCGGVADIVENGKTGWLVAERTPDALAERLLFVLDHPDWAERAGQAGKEKILRAFSPEHTGQCLLDIYRDLGLLLPDNDVFHPGADHSFPPVETEFLWNGLKCGDSCLSASAYKAFRDFIRAAGVKSILEFGAGYTTVFFRQNVEKQIAIEGWNGPWLDFARSRGGDVRVLPFSPQSGFNESAVAAAAAEVFAGGGESLVFIDSPPGTHDRERVMEQGVRLAPHADYYVFHHSARDAELVDRLANRLGLKVVRHFPSRRGLSFLGRKAVRFHHAPPHGQASLEKMRFSVRCLDPQRHRDGRNEIHIELRNAGETVIACGDNGDLCFTAHFFHMDDSTLALDLPRYVLPTDLEPGDGVSFWMTLPHDPTPIWALEFDLLHEGKHYWSQRTGSSRPRIALFDRGKVKSEFLANAILSFTRGDNTAALDGLEAAAQADPANPLIYVYRALLAARAAQVEEARAFIARARELSPDRPDFLAAVGEEFLNADLPAEALRYLEPAIQADPGMLAAYPALAEAMRLTGRREEALNLLQCAAAFPSDVQEKIIHLLSQWQAEG